MKVKKLDDKDHTTKYIIYILLAYALITLTLLVIFYD